MSERRWFDGLVREVVSVRFVKTSHHTGPERIERLSCGHEQCFEGNRKGDGPTGVGGPKRFRVCQSCSIDRYGHRGAA